MAGVLGMNKKTILLKIVVSILLFSNKTICMQKEKLKLLETSGILYPKLLYETYDISTNGEILAFLENKNSIKFYDLKKQTYLCEHINKANIYNIKTTPLGKHAIFSDYDNNVQVYDIKNQKIITHYTHERSIISIAITNNGKYTASASTNKSIKVYNTHKNKLIFEITLTHLDLLPGVRVTENGKYLAFAIKELQKNKVQVYNVTTKTLMFEYKNKTLIDKIALSESGKYAAFASQCYHYFMTGVFSKINVSKTNSQELCEYRHKKKLKYLHFTPCAKLLTSVSKDGNIKISDVKKREVISNIDTKEEVKLVCLTNNYKKLIITNKNEEVKTYKTPYALYFAGKAFLKNKKQQNIIQKKLFNKVEKNNKLSDLTIKTS